MSNRKKLILDSAANVFARYGVKRATMNDIASEAGVARQTLYNAFDNKEALLRALIQQHVDETCRALNEHAGTDGNLPAGLEIAFDYLARKPYELLRNTPHGGEIMGALEDAAGEEMIESKKRFVEAMGNLLGPHLQSGSRPGISARELADFIVHTTMGHKTKAASEEHLETLLGTLKHLIVDRLD